MSLLVGANSSISSILVILLAKLTFNGTIGNRTIRDIGTISDNGDTFP